MASGISGFPIDRCAQIMLQTTINYLEGQTDIEKVVFCLFGQDSFKVFENQLQQMSCV
jgi:O-acetyl-ADP-ribose deacetylase (regulator of RNase III)